MYLFTVEAPNLLTRLTPVTVKEGDSITLMVTISGTSPEVTWYREGSEITSVYKNDFTVSYNTLVFLNLHFFSPLLQ